MIFCRFLPLLLLFGLIAAPSAAFSAASDTALLWWTRVLPSLLPYLIAAALLERSGLLQRLSGRFASLLLLPLGALGGYPIGARLAGRLFSDGVLPLSDARKAASWINLPNPVFLISVVSAGFFRDPRTAFPLLIGVYGAALIGLIPLSRVRMKTAFYPSKAAPACDLPAAIGDGVRAILNVGGCIVFASVLGALVDATGLFRLFGAGAPAARAIATGLFEMTSGASLTAALPFSLSPRLAICACLLSFGGISVLLQSASALPISVPKYLLVRAVLGAVSGTITFLLTPLFCTETAVPTLASGPVMLQNTIDLTSIVLASAFGLLLVFVFTFGLKARKRS